MADSGFILIPSAGKLSWQFEPDVVNPPDPPDPPDPIPPDPPSNNVVVARSSSLVDIQAAVDQAVDGSVVQIPAGQAVWSSGIHTTKQIRIEGMLGQSVSLVNQSGSAPLFRLRSGDQFHVGVGRIRFLESSGMANAVEMYGAGRKVPLLYDSFFEVKQRNGNAEEISLVDWKALGGVIWGSEFLGKGTGGVAGVGSEGASLLVKGSPRLWTTPSTMGSLDINGNTNLYIEDCSWMHVGQFPDIDDHGRVVMRRNQINGANGLTHGFTSLWGGRHVELYENRFSVTNRLRNHQGKYFWLRAGTAVICDNFVDDATFPSEYGHPNILNIGDNTAPGTYLQPRQPGCGHNGQNYVSDPIYIWGNTWPRKSSVGFQNGWQSIVQEGRDLFVDRGAKPGYQKYPYPHPARQVVG